MDQRVQSAIAAFALKGKQESLVPFKIGHINETYVSAWQVSSGLHRYIHQRINHNVFRNVPELMQNVERVVAHVNRKGRRGLTLLPTLAGNYFFRDEDGDFWRTYEYLENTTSYNVCPGPRAAFEAARVCGEFLRDLADLPPPALYDTIPLFHNTPNRYRLLRDARNRDPVRRAESAKEEIRFALEREKVAASVVEKLASGVLPMRATHNDLKLNNVLFDSKNQSAICVVDLDTCMPGSSLYDFGDLARSTSVTSAEDETELSRVSMDEELFEQLVRGYLAGSAGLLTGEEIALMGLAPRLIALALGVRFLTDYLDGDTYFRIHHPRHNLERSRTQFKIVADMEAREGRMRALVERYASAS